MSHSKNVRFTIISHLDSFLDIRVLDRGDWSEFGADDLVFSGNHTRRPTEPCYPYRCADFQPLQPDRLTLNLGHFGNGRNQARLPATEIMPRTILR
jgi:hypothetical protein